MADVYALTDVLAGVQRQAGGVEGGFEHGFRDRSGFH